MFVDIVKIRIKAGKGGDGAVHFHREKYVAAGGPDGGDGGKGGNIIFQADTNLSTLIDFKYKTKYAAEPGENGSGKNCFGKNGQDLIIKVPKGTVVKDANTGRIMADLSGPDPVLVADAKLGILSASLAAGAAGATAILPPLPDRFPGFPSLDCLARSLRLRWS